MFKEVKQKMKVHELSDKSEILTISVKEIREKFGIKRECKEAGMLGKFLIIKVDKVVKRGEERN